MQTQKTQDPAQLPDDIVIPSGDEIYDSIMVQIEPELTTNQLPLLKEKYKGETPEESQARKVRYDEAFKKYDEAYARYISDLKRKVAVYVRTAYASAERQERAEELKAMENLEAAMNM